MGSTAARIGLRIRDSIEAMRLGLAAATAILLWTTSAHADRSWKRRYAHMGAVGVGVAVFLASELPLKDDLAPEACRWCEPNRLDAGVRSALVWNDPLDAQLTSDIGGFVLAPIVTIGL